MRSLGGEYVDWIMHGIYTHNIENYESILPFMPTGMWMLDKDDVNVKIVVELNNEDDDCAVYALQMAMNRKDVGDKFKKKTRHPAPYSTHDILTFCRNEQLSIILYDGNKCYLFKNNKMEVTIPTIQCVDNHFQPC